MLELVDDLDGGPPSRDLEQVLQQLIGHHWVFVILATNLLHHCDSPVCLRDVRLVLDECKIEVKTPILL